MKNYTESDGVDSSELVISDITDLLFKIEELKGKMKCSSSQQIWKCICAVNQHRILVFYLKMDSFNLIKYVYSQDNDSDNVEGKWFLFGDVLKDNVWVCVTT